MSWSSSSGWNGKGWGRAASGVTPATFVAAASGYVTSSGGNFSLAAGAAGNLAILAFWEGFAPPGTVVSPGNASVAWTLLDRTTFNTRSVSLWARVLNAADIASGVTIGNGNNPASTIGISFYSGATIATFKGTASAATSSTSSATLAPASFSPSGSSKGVVLVSIDEADSASPSIVATAGGTTMTARVARHDWTANQYQSDLLSGYAGGAFSVTYQGAATNKVVWQVELT